jgi:hypothetical protein
VKWGPGFAQAEADFARELMAKDLAHLMIYLPDGPDSPRAEAVEALLQIDNGIALEARSALNFERSRE